MSSPFLAIPAEIREQIYSEVLSTANSKLPSTNNDAEEEEPAASYKYHLDILRVNHQIHHEAKKIFQDNIFVKITTPWPEAIEHIRSEGKVPCITTGHRAAAFPDFHLGVFIDTPMTPYPDSGHSFSMLIALDDLPLFTQMWHIANLNHFGLNRHLRLKLTLQDPHVPDRKLPKALQTQLLLPFGAVKELHSFSLSGGNKVLPSVSKALAKARDTPDPTPEECLERSLALKTAGNDLLKAGSYRLALEKYTAAFAAIHITIRGRVRLIHADGFYIRELTSGTYKGQRGDYVRMILRVQLVANVVLAYLNARDYEEAFFWGKRSILLFRMSVTGERSDEISLGGHSHRSGNGNGASGDGNGADDDDAGEDPPIWLHSTLGARFPGNDAMGRIFYRTGLAARALGKEKDVRTLMRAAGVYLPGDRTVMEEVRALDGGGGGDDGRGSGGADNDSGKSDGGAGISSGSRQ